MRSYAQRARETMNPDLTERSSSNPVRWAYLIQDDEWSGAGVMPLTSRVAALLANILILSSLDILAKVPEALCLPAKG
jgi:hypothetical protein